MTGMQGLVFNIQKFSVHDGPGIRTTVFLKGCPLSCPWCSNPESQRFAPELLMRDVNCRACGACAAVCPQKAIVITKKGGRKIDRQKCNLCLRCVEYCHYDALKSCGTYMTVGTVMDEILQDRLFYANSGGGVTLSGGEPLAQPVFARLLLEACKKEGMHTALETAGAGSSADLERVLKCVDLVLFDIKHLDSKRHAKTTGVPNARILANLRKAASQSRIWLRIPLIAGFNDSERHIQEVARLGVEIGAEKISLLPYHEGGKSKSEQLGIAYAYCSGKSPGEKRIKKLQSLILQSGLKVGVGS